MNATSPRSFTPGLPLSPSGTGHFAMSKLTSEPWRDEGLVLGLVLGLGLGLVLVLGLVLGLGC